MAAFRSFAALPRGGMDTIGAERLLIGNAVSEIATQLEAWAKAGAKKDGP